MQKICPPLIGFANESEIKVNAYSHNSIDFQQRFFIKKIQLFFSVWLLHYTYWYNEFNMRDMKLIHIESKELLKKESCGLILLKDELLIA